MSTMQIELKEVAAGGAVFRVCQECHLLTPVEQLQDGDVCLPCWDPDRYAEPTPPTLAEWMGDELENLPPEWRSVLRERPVPAGPILEWWWDGRTWCYRQRSPRKAGGTTHATEPVFVRMAATHCDGPKREALQMSMFTRHPDVSPTPRPIQCWAPYEQQGDDL